MGGGMADGQSFYGEMQTLAAGDCGQVSAATHKGQAFPTHPLPLPQPFTYSAEGATSLQFANCENTKMLSWSKVWGKEVLSLSWEADPPLGPFTSPWTLERPGVDTVELSFSFVLL